MELLPSGVASCNRGGAGRVEEGREVETLRGASSGMPFDDAGF